jgi:hypothetical protein
MLTALANATFALILTAAIFGAVALCIGYGCDVVRLGRGRRAP